MSMHLRGEGARERHSRTYLCRYIHLSVSCIWCDAVPLRACLQQGVSQLAASGPTPGVEMEEETLRCWRALKLSLLLFHAVAQVCRRSTKSIRDRTSSGQRSTYEDAHNASSFFDSHTSSYTYTNVTCMYVYMRKYIYIYICKSS